MSIFKDQKFVNTEKLKNIKLILKIFNLANRILMLIGIVFNGIMSLMMIIKFSPLFVFFAINTYFFLMNWKGLKFKYP